ncbi:MAG: glycoside hydrolase domain-containing protein [Armatimonadia bacterium]
MSYLLCLTMILTASLAAAAPVAHPAFEPPSPQVLDLGENLLLKAKTTSSPHWSTCVPDHAVDGRHDSPSPHWAAENIPVWHQVELKEPREINLIRLWTFWDHKRYYQYFIEGSPDGQNWTVLGDRRENTTPQTEAGETFSFPAIKVKYLRTTFTHNSAGNATGGHIVEIEAHALTPEQAAAFAAQDKLWGNWGTFEGYVGSVDSRYRRYAPMLDEGMSVIRAAEHSRAWSAVAWRGERVHAQVVLSTRTGAQQVRFKTQDLKSDTGATLPAACIRPRFVRYVMADGKLMPDILDTAQRLDLAPQTSRPVWITIDVPRDAAPGRYNGTLQALAAGQKPVRFGLNVEVLAPILPPPSQWQFRLDLWQNPYSVARYHGVENWSEAHLKLLEPHLRLLADAGQKCVTTSIIHRPWGGQTYDPYDSMVEWIKQPDGTFRYDYRNFDTYVALAMKCGITDSISCYTVASPRYLDEATGEYTSGGYTLQDLWGPFLKDFTAHLKEKGWLGKTALAMDEWPLERMLPMIEFLRKTAPDLKIALAGGNHPELADKIDDWCVFITPPLDPAIAKARAAKGLPTTTYVCCGPGRPNTFTASPPAESAWLGWYCAAQGYSGLLRWAYDSWVADPLQDTSHVTWTAGDCFLVYPGARSSIRFERLREGIQDFEKVRIVREKLRASQDPAAKEALQKLEQALGGFTYQKAQTEPAEVPVNAAKRALEEASKLVK